MVRGRSRIIRPSRGRGVPQAVSLDRNAAGWDVFMKLAVVGTGYVGLVTGTCFAESGNEVVGIDKVAEKVAMLERGEVPIYEPGLTELVHRNHREGRLRFTTDLPSGIAEAELVFIAVGTP